MANQTLKGFRDFFAGEIAVRQGVIDILKEQFNLFGFSPLETPALEYGETLLGKYGAEADKLVYTFKDRGERLVGLRYDLTVPLARVVAEYQGSLQLPFKRYQVQPVWRAENTQKGRYREFWQGDCDIVGDSSILADAEIITLAHSVFKKINIPNFKIKINDRKILFELMDLASVKKEEQLSVIQSIDKLDKKSENEVREELKGKGISSGIIEEVFRLLGLQKPNQNIADIFRFAEASGVLKENLEFSPYLSRGLDYYTGPIFEVSVTEPNLGSLAGGGRYDNLIEKLGGPSVPATGIAFGVERIIDIVAELNLKLSEKPPKKRVLLCPLGKGSLERLLGTASTLRTKGVVAELFKNPEAKLEKQLKYADYYDFNYVIISGEKENQRNIYTLKNLGEKSQMEVGIEKVVNLIE